MFEDTNAESLTSIIIVKHAALLSNGLGQAFSIYIPEGYGLSLLRRFVYSGCKAIGEREHNKLMMECGKRVFPVDYPETSSGSNLLHIDALTKLKSNYCPRPPSKRVNFQVIKQPAPFNPLPLFPDLDEKSATHVILQSFTRGVPFSNSLIYMPTADDIRTIRNQHAQGK